jgi:hypothetical protein
LDEEHLGFIPCTGTEAAKEYWAFKKPNQAPSSSRGGGQNKTVDAVKRAQSMNKLDPIAVLWNSVNSQLDQQLKIREWVLSPMEKQGWLDHYACQIASYIVSCMEDHDNGGAVDNDEELQ